MMSGAEVSPTDRLHPHNGTVLVYAARDQGVRVTPNDIDYFKACSRIAAVLDDMVDTEGTMPDLESALTSPEELFSNRFSSLEEELVVRVVSNLSSERRDAWLDARMLPDMAAQKSEAKTIKSLGEALTAEAALFTRVFSLEPVGDDSSARSRFNTWLSHFSRGGYFVDGAVDMKHDYEAGRIAVLPTLQNRANLVTTGLHELGAVMKLSKGARVIGELAKTSLLTVLESTRTDAVSSTLRTEV